jgi:hypothetical protein
MPVSQVDLCNAALIKIAQDIPIAAMSESSKAARAFTRVYGSALDLVLTEHPWPFTLKAVALSPSPDAAFPGWAYRYDEPSDCLTKLAVCSSDGVRAGLAAASLWSYDGGQALPLGDGRVDFETVWGSQATNIVTDLSGAYLIYSMRVVDIGRFPPLFCEALSCQLAVAVAPALAGELGVRLAQKLQQDYEVARAKAIAHGFNESRDRQQATTPSVAARGGC